LRTAEHSGRKPDFHPTPAPRDDDVAGVAASVFRRVERKLRDREPGARQRRFVEEAPLLVAIADASARGAATGPRRGWRIVRVRGPTADVDAFVMGRLCAEVEGFNLQAATRVGASDRLGLERMARYLARPPIATERLSQLDDGRLQLRLKRPWRDGTTALVFTPRELIELIVARAIFPSIPSRSPPGVALSLASVRSMVSAIDEASVLSDEPLPQPATIRTATTGDRKRLIIFSTPRLQDYRHIAGRCRPSE
jgi:hypothetical protein